MTRSRRSTRPTERAEPTIRCGGQRDPTELRKALQDQMGKVAVRRLHLAAEAMLELGEEEKMTWSASRSFQNLRVLVLFLLRW